MDVSDNLPANSETHLEGCIDEDSFMECEEMAESGYLYLSVLIFDADKCYSNVLPNPCDILPLYMCEYLLQICTLYLCRYFLSV